MTDRITEPSLPAGATAYWDDCETAPVFVHRACRPAWGGPWGPVGNLIELLEDDVCGVCGGSMFKEPVQ